MIDAPNRLPAWLRTAVLIGGLGALAAAPLLGAGNFMIVVNLLVGYTKLFTLAHAAYFGVGAYATALAANNWGANSLMQLGVAIGAAAAVAAASGWIAVRTSGTMFLMLSLAIGELLQILALQWESVTRGSNGLSAAPPFEIFPGVPVTLTGVVYWYAFVVFLVVVGLLVLLSRSPFGWALRGIGDNEARMRAIGYPTAIYKYTVFVISGAVAGAAGWVLVAQLPRFVSPESMSFMTAGLILLAVVIGGQRSMVGSFIGAALIVVVNVVLSPNLNGHGPLLLGVVFMVAVYALPRGLSGMKFLQGRLAGANVREEGR